MDGCGHLDGRMSRKNVDEKGKKSGVYYQNVLEYIDLVCAARNGGNFSQYRIS